MSARVEVKIEAGGLPYIEVGGSRVVAIREYAEIVGCNGSRIGEHSCKG